MSYTPFEDRVLPLLFLYIGLAVASFFLTIDMYIKWKERKVTPPLLMTLIFGLFTSALIMLAVGLADSKVAMIYRELYRFSLPFGYVMILLSDVILFKFASDITGHGKKAFKPIIVMGALLSVILFLPWNWWGVPSVDYTGQLNLRLYSTLGLIAFSYVIYITIAWVCRRVMVDAKTQVAKVGLSLMFWAMIAMIMFFLMFVFDTVLIVAFDHPGYSEFVYVGWIFAVVFFVCMYLSVVMPEWFVSRITKKSLDSQS